ncbi:hypothetical protein PG994_002983 [Apiospora phragmitis]|uniref:Uncharacterized protein n=1 Tax=Apiospora phragmitis TaxID=2905665 RepID=A0ABR1W9J2_9PEZI
MTSQSSKSRLPSPPRDPSGGGRSSNRRRRGHDTAEGSCQCVSLMLSTLESMGSPEGSAGGEAYNTTGGAAATSLDDVLGSLARGMNVVEQVLRCGRCNAGSENRMLLATIAQQLSTTATSLATGLPPHQDRAYESVKGIDWWRNRRVSSSTQGGGPHRQT